MKDIKNRFLSSLKMANKLFIMYDKKAKNANLKSLIEKSSNRLKRQETELIDVIKRLNKIPNDNMMFGQKMAIQMEKLCLVGIHSDKGLIKKIVKSLNMGIKSATKLLYENFYETEDLFQNKAKEIISEHNDIRIMFENLLSNI